MMKLRISPRAEKQLRKLPKVDQIAIARRVRQLATSGITTNVEVLRGYKNIFRLGLGNYRVVYRKTSLELYIILIGHRKDIYRLLKGLLS